MSKRKQGESTRGELEFARNVRDVFAQLPYQALLNLLRGVEDSIGEYADDKAPVKQSTKNTVNPIRPWLTHEEKLQYYRHATLPVEALPLDGEKQNRFDLVIPIPPRQMSGKLITSIIFEFKLGPHDPTQLQTYANLAPNSLVVSIAKDDPVVGPIRSNNGNLWIIQTWEHLYFALRNLLSSDAQSRSSEIAPPECGLLDFDYRAPGADRLTFIIEKLLTHIEVRDLLPLPGLTLVVPRGKYARETLPYFYAHPNGWRAGYKYLAVISGNVLEKVYKVTCSYTSEELPDGSQSRPKGLSPGAWQYLLDEASSLRVSMLDELMDDPNVNAAISKKFIKRSASGRATSFTQSHRYVNTLEELSKIFNSNT